MRREEGVWADEGKRKGRSEGEGEGRDGRKEVGKHIVQRCRGLLEVGEGAKDGRRGGN
jgi:hypothetical protein